MKIITSPRNSGHLILVFVLFVAIVAIIWMGFKIIDKLQKNPPDPTHGYGTNDLDVTFAPQMDQLKRLLPANSMVEVTLPIEFKNAKVIVPLESLAYRWHWQVQSSSNFVNWVETDLDWEQALEMNRTNHSGQQGYFRRVLIW